MTDKTIIVADDHAVAMFIRHGVMFEEMLHELRFFSDEVRVYYDNGSFRVATNEGQIVCMNAGHALREYLKALINASAASTQDPS